LTLKLPYRRLGSRLLCMLVLTATFVLTAPFIAHLGAQRPATSHASATVSSVSSRSGERSAPSLTAPQPHLRSHIGLHLGLGGRWWDNEATIKELKLSAAQQRRMDSIFETNKPTLMSLYLNMQQEQTRLSTLSPSDLQDQSKVYAAIDRVSQARSDLEKENAYILIQIRQQLDTQQLQVLDREIATLQ
jgi:Spy/CpxP family protein refolding chaperone